MTLAELASIAGLLVAALGASFNYFKLEHSQRTELWSVGRSAVQIAWRSVRALMHIFFVVWPIFSMWVFVAKSGTPTRVEILTLLMNFTTLLVWVALSMVELRDWLRARKARKLIDETPTPKRRKKPAELKRNTAERPLDSMSGGSASIKP